MYKEQIIKREDGSRVRIGVAFNVNYETLGWKVQVHKSDKNKRKWIDVLDYDSDIYRAFPFGSKQREEWKRNEQLKHVSVAEVKAVMLEIWNSLKPTF